MEDFHNFLIVLAKVLTQDFFVKTFDAQEVLRNDFFNTLLLVFLVFGGFIRLGFDLFNAFEMTDLRFELVFFVFVFFFLVYFQNQRFNSQRRFFVELQDKLLRSLVVQFHIQHGGKFVFKIGLLFPGGGQGISVFIQVGVKFLFLDALSSGKVDTGHMLIHKGHLIGLVVISLNVELIRLRLLGYLINDVFHSDDFEVMVVVTQDVGRGLLAFFGH